MKQPKSKNCIECSKSFQQYNSLQRSCSVDCAILYSKKHIGIKRNKDILSYENAKVIDKYEKQLKASLINTKMQVHSFVRERDKFKPCISCGVQWNDLFQCGHHYKSETFETLKFNLDNLSGQCRKCNLFLEGNFDNYALNLPNRIGEERYNELVRLAGIDKQFSKVWNLENLKDIRNNLKRL